jgi:hypothetical protein
MLIYRLLDSIGFDLFKIIVLERESYSKVFLLFKLVDIFRREKKKMNSK